ncbi:FMN-dependent alpha-hydroxy acid dehydrogenase [Favolaschia claudopus]|uniref:FMN-dependent alpha-hydroxy acid dehydrogenase n=1 Tax=Favolaschia claudopus TaxID=2862362 RepID=A0AAW0AY34_9AGAR
MDPTNKPKGPSPHYSLYQREVFKRGGTTGQLPTFSVHPEKLSDSVKTKLGDRSYFYANSNAGLGWTDRANREAFYRWRIVPRMLVDTNERDLSTTLFGHRIPAPILFAPIGINKLYAPPGELIPAKIAGELGLPYCLSTAASQPIEDVAAANDAAAQAHPDSGYAYVGEQRTNESKAPRFFQLYMGHDDEITLSLMTRAFKSGFDVLMLTVDTWQLGWRPTDIDIANYAFYYPNSVGNELAQSDPVFMRKHAADLEKDSGKWIDSAVWHGKAHTWEKVRWAIREWKRISSSRPFLLKGIQCAADARKALQAGCDGVVVSNHAGRQVDGAVASLEALEEVVREVGGGECRVSSFIPASCFGPLAASPLSRSLFLLLMKTTIIYDSGIRTGADIFKALALGANAVGVGRMWVWGMAHEGESGCRHVMKSVLADLDITMTVAGYRSIEKDVRGNRDALRFNPYGVPPGEGEYAKL